MSKRFRIVLWIIIALELATIGAVTAPPLSITTVPAINHEQQATNSPKFQERVSSIPTLTKRIWITAATILLFTIIGAYVVLATTGVNVGSERRRLQWF